MSIAEMRQELMATINSLEDDKLMDVYDAVQHCLNDDDDEEWNEPIALAEIEEAIKELDEGKGIPLEEVMREIREKYNLNG